MNPRSISGNHLRYSVLGRRAALLLAMIGLAVLTAFPALTAPRVIANAQAASELAAYQLPDGSTPYICFSGSGDPSQDDGTARHCPLCTLCEISPLPSHKLRSAFFLLERHGKPASPARVPVVSHASGGLGPRAPPAIVTS